MIARRPGLPVRSFGPFDAIVVDTHDGDTLTLDNGTWSGYHHKLEFYWCGRPSTTQITYFAWHWITCTSYGGIKCGTEQHFIYSGCVGCVQITPQSNQSVSGANMAGMSYRTDCIRSQLLSDGWTQYDQKWWC